MQELTTEFLHRHRPVLCGSTGRPYRPCCSRASARFQRRGPDPLRASITDSRLATAPVAHLLHPPARLSANFALLSAGFAELLSALVAKITMTSWPNAVAFPKVHPRQAWTRGQDGLGRGVEMDGDGLRIHAYRITEVWGSRNHDRDLNFPINTDICSRNCIYCGRHSA